MKEFSTITTTDYNKLLPRGTLHILYDFYPKVAQDEASGSTSAGTKYFLPLAPLAL
jgi:hypothetical protein